MATQVNFSIKNFLWITPFLCFLCTYFILHLLLSIAPFATPAVVGQPLTQAIKILSSHTLNTRLLSESEDNDLPPGTVTSQSPHAQQKIKPYQTVFLTISKKPPALCTPDLATKSIDTITTLLDKNGIQCKIVHLASMLPEHTCIGQLPQAGHVLEQKRMTIYLSASNKKPVIFPSCKNLLATDVLEFLANHGLKTNVIHAHTVDEDHTCNYCRVIDQKPLAGSLIDLNKPLTVQLYVR